ncbi:ATP-dependent DNA helicase [Candidatus Woesearchaeota archaeon]|nr:ATP-dependent DNA helicase [Candidatus Woesearchaeota archaeon]
MADETGGEAERFLFPHDSFRDIQKDLVHEVAVAFEKKASVVAHAPTGLGKTAAVLAPALAYAIKNDKKVFFLTSRHTQHVIAIDTLRQIKEKYDTDLIALDLIGKKWMCPVPGVDGLRSGDFADYCRKQKENQTCEHFNNTKSGGKPTPKAKLALETLKSASPCHIERFVELCGEDDLCAYELATTLAKDAKVIVADYYYIYNSAIRDSFFNKAQVSLPDCIIIVDEGHNLPDRIRNLMTVQLSNFMIKRALNEAKKLKDDRLTEKVLRLRDVLDELTQDMRMGDETTVSKDVFVAKVNSALGDYDVLVADLDLAGQHVKTQEKQSSLSSVAAFLDQWLGDDVGFARILSLKQTKNENLSVLSYKCLDPSLFTKEVIENCHSTILMSGTLTPTSMYKDILGFPEGTVEKRYASPFPEKNRLSLIVPETTTKFAARSDQMYERIAEICAEVTNIVPGNSALFFPSYFLRDQVYNHFVDISKKTAFVERSEMNKEEKAEFLDNFKSYKESGAVLLGVVSGSFGEGVDLPGDLLKCVMVVGLPLQQPTLETKSLIDYYEQKFGKGWDYGYVGPAFAKTLQSAGRCIRSETDRGVIVFLDERYVWQNYFKHFPIDWNVDVSKDYKRKVAEFFSDLSM